jgi:hypothetical protein
VTLPTIKKDKIKPGDVMIGHHLLIAPALLLEDDRKLPLDEGSFLDLCTMVNALTLHDRLITLRILAGNEIPLGESISMTEVGSEGP